jgi:hypothetical protein
VANLGFMWDAVNMFNKPKVNKQALKTPLWHREDGAVLPNYLAVWRYIGYAVFLD